MLSQIKQEQSNIMSIHSVSVQEAEGHLAELLKLVDQGEDVVITRKDGAKVHLVIEIPRKSKRVAGLHAGKGWVSDDFNEPLGDDFLLGGE